MACVRLSNDSCMFPRKSCIALSISERGEKRKIGSVGEEDSMIAKFLSSVESASSHSLVAAEHLTVTYKHALLREISWHRVSM